MKKKQIYIIAAVIMLLAAAFGLWQILRSTYTPATVLSEEVAPVTATAAPTPTEPPAALVEEEPEVTEEPAEEEEAYDCPIDFESLRSVNSDIYAWLEIDNTDISYPIVQAADGDNEFYLNHNTDGKYSANGSIFSEDYNSTDWTDPVTVLYGHHMSSGAMFGNLQQDFSDAEFFENTPVIRIYTEDKLLEYGVFAAVPYSNDHLLYWNDFTDEDVFESFFEAVFNIRSLDAQFREEYAPEAGDNVLILSTCLAGNNTRRFLVMATLLQ
jgi:sortase B